MKDIVTQLREDANRARSNYPEVFCVSEELAEEAADEIERLRKALREIGYDYVELSYDKAVVQRNEHMKIAYQAYVDSFPKSEYGKPMVEVDDNF